MEYVLFNGFNRVGTMFPCIEDAKSFIDGIGIWNIFGVVAKDGKLKIVSRETVVVES